MTEPHSRSCETIEPLLTAFVLEELSGSERSDVASHIASCPQCRDEVSLLSSTASLIAGGGPAESRLGAEERGRVLAAARAPEGARKKATRGVFTRWAGGLAAAAAVVVIGWIAMRPSPPLNSPAPRLDDGITLARLEPPPEAAKPATRPLEVETRREPAPVFRDGADFTTSSRASLNTLAPEASAAASTASTAPAAPAAAPSVARADLPKEPPATQDSLATTDLRLSFQEVAAENKPNAAFGRGGSRPTDFGVVERGLNPAGERDRNFRFADPRTARTNSLDEKEDVSKRKEVELAKLQPGPQIRIKTEGIQEEQYRQPMKRRADEARKKEDLAQAGGAAEPQLTGGAAAPPKLAAVPATPGPAAPNPGAVPPKPGATPLQGLGAPPAKSVSEKAPAAGPGAGATDAYFLSDAPVSSTPTRDYKVEVDDILTRLDRKPGETPDMMFFRFWGDNPFVEASADALSTFGVDVDTASFTLARSYFYKQGALPPREAIRTEEFINYFKGRYPPPPADGPAFAIHVEMAATPFAHEAEYRLLRVGVKGREVSRAQRKACALVFVIDTSGSMRRENRLELVKDALKLLVKELDEGDSIGIVAFDREARTVLEPAPASEKERILDAIATLEPRQNTNVAAGLDLGYRMAGAHLSKDGSNRVILLSDGVANTGILDVNTMLEQIRTQRERGVYLTTVGVGMGNLNDALLEQLADRGNGQCVYVDRIEAAHKAFVENLTGTLETIARDVKIQVEFDPAKVLRYRLLGYENRAIADSAFRDNTVDAGEVGAGHEVTALYELKLKPDSSGSPPASGKLAAVRVRYLTVDHGEAQEIEKPVDASAAKTAFAEASPRFRLHACVGELAEVLRDSYWARGSSLDRVASMLGDILDLRETEGGSRIGDDADVIELVALVKKADALVRRRAADADDVARAVDAIKDNLYLSARVEDELRARGEQNRAQIDEIRRQNDDLRRRLESLLAK